MNLKQRLIEWLQGVPDDESPAGHTAAMSESESAQAPPDLTAALRESVNAAPRHNAEAETLRAQLARERAENVRNAAVRFAEEQQEVATPAAMDPIRALFTQLERDDRELPGEALVHFAEDGRTPVKRVELLTAMFAALPKHGLTTELLTTGEVPSGSVALTNTAETKTAEEREREAQMSAESIDELLAMTSLGKAAMAERNGR